MDLRIGDLIQELRKDRGLTQSQLGQLLGVGYGAIHGYESGKSLPSLDSLVLLADYFDLNTDYMLGRTKFETNQRGSTLKRVKQSRPSERRPKNKGIRLSR